MDDSSSFWSGSPIATSLYPGLEEHFTDLFPGPLLDSAWLGRQNFSGISIPIDFDNLRNWQLQEGEPTQRDYPSRESRGSRFNPDSYSGGLTFPPLPLSNQPLTLALEQETAESGSLSPGGGYSPDTLTGGAIGHPENILDHVLDTISPFILGSQPNSQLVHLDLSSSSQSAPIPPPSAQQAVLWGVDEDDSQLFRLGDYTDPLNTREDYGSLYITQNGESINIKQVSAFTIDNDNQTAYIAVNRDSDSIDSPWIGKIDLDAVHAGGPNEVAFVGSVNLKDNDDRHATIRGLDIDPITGDLYGLLYEKGNDDLIVLDKDTGQIQQNLKSIINSKERVERGEDLVFDSEGNLYVIDSKDDELYRVDKRSARILETVDSKVEQGLGSRKRVEIEGLAWDPQAQQLVFTEEKQDLLGTLSLKSGNNQIIAATTSIGLTDVEGIDFQLITPDPPPPPPPVNAPILWGVDEDDSQLFRLGDYTDPLNTREDYGSLYITQNGESINIKQVSAFTIDNDNQTAYIAVNRDSDSIDSPWIGKIDLDAVHVGGPNEVAFVGSVNLKDNDDRHATIRGLDIDPITGDLYGLLYEKGNDDLIVLDKDTGQIQQNLKSIINSKERVERGEDLVFDSEGNLYVIDSKDDELYRVDKRSARILETVDSKVEQGLGSRKRVEIEGLAWDPQAQQLVFTEEKQDLLGTLSLKSGNNQIIAATTSIGLTDVEGIDFQLQSSSPNSPPEAVADNYEVDEDGILIVNVADGVLANDTDPDADPLTAVLFSGPNSGTLNLNPDGSLSYTPSPNFNGLDSFVYEVSDGQGGTATETVEITVNPVNDAPVLLDQEFSIDENSAKGTIIGTISVTDQDLDPLSFAVMGGTGSTAFAVDPDTGVITVADSNQLDFETTPSLNLEVEVADSQGLTDTATVTLEVLDLNEAPFIEAQGFAIPENSPNGTVVGTVSASDPDAGDTLLYQVIGGSGETAFQVDGASGDITVLDETQLDFESNESFSLVVQVSDQDGLTEQATVTITVLDLFENVAPVIEDQRFEVPENSGLGTVVGQVVASDPNAGDTLTYSIVTGNEDGNFSLDSATGEIAINDPAGLDFEDIAQYSLTVQVEDLGDLTDSAIVTVDVVNVNEAPSVEVPSEQSVQENETLEISGIEISDVDAGTSSLKVSLSVANGTLGLAQTAGLNFSAGDGFEDGSMIFSGSIADINAAVAQLSYQGNQGFIGGDIISVAVNDLGNSGTGGPQADQATIALEVTPAPNVSGTIEGISWQDENGNGELEATEAGIAGLTVFLDLNNNGFLNANEPSQVTDGQGRYQFTNLEAGTYRVWQEAVEGLQPTAPQSLFYTLDLVAGETLSNINFGNQAFVLPTGTAEISGFKWEDINADGDRDPLEDGLDGVTIYLDLNQNAQLDLNEPTQVTDSEGNYRFTGLAAGDYDVREVQQSGFRQTFPVPELVEVDGLANPIEVPSAQQVTVSAGEIATGIDFGNKKNTGEIRGVTWDDLDADGVFDANESPIDGFTVYLDLNDNGQIDVNEPSQRSSATSQYRFRDLTEGRYIVRQLVSLDYEQTFPTDSGSDFYTLNLNAGEVIENVDFGNRLRVDLDNQPPSFTSTPSTSGMVNTEYSYQAIASDPDVDLLTFTVVEGPDGLTIDEDSGLILWTPTEGQVGNAEIMIEVADGEGLSATQSFVVTVNPRETNQAPVFISEPIIDFAIAASGNATGSVSPTQLSFQLEDGETFTDTVSITLGEQVPLVDIVLLLDDTVSFAESGPLLVSQFPNIIDNLKNRFPNIDFGFGLARYEDYAGVELESGILNSTTYPYTLNSPIVSSEEPGFDIAFASALQRNISDPLLGQVNDRPEALIEGLYQVATGLGFDGNNDGDTTDNGVAGSFGAQTLSFPPAQNEVPAFETYDPFPIQEVIDLTRSAISLQIPEDEISTVSRTGLPLEFGEIVSGSINEVGQEDIYTFTLTERSLVYMDEIVFSTGTTPDLNLESSLLSYNPNFKDGSIADLPAGDYSIVANSLRHPILSGNYAFRLLKLKNAVALEFDSPVNGSIQPARETDVFQFEAEAGDIIYLDINSDFNTTLTLAEWRLLNPSAERTQIGGFDSFGVEELFRIDESGTQTLLLEGTFAFTGVTNVDYDIEIQKVPNSAFEASSTIGGVGFRPGALPIILATADSETVYQPDGVDTITGINGVEIPLSDLIEDDASRIITPDGRGASVQPTIDALNDLGALVIGLGADIDILGLDASGSDPTQAPRRTLEGIALLTGAINASSEAIDGGIEGDLIDPGEPLYFLISQDSGERIANGISAGVEAALTATSFDVDLSASTVDPVFQNLSGILSGVSPGEQAEFSVEFTGDGTAQEFELLFTRPGTGIILGSIPVNINNGYFYAAQAIDPDEDSLSYSLVEAPDGATIDAENGQLQWTPSGTGVFDFTVLVEDGRGGQATQSFALSIADRSENNSDPMITPIPPISANTDQEFSYQVFANDADGDSLKYYLTTAPEGMFINPGSGNITWTPNANQIGSQKVVVRVIDERGGTASQSFSVEVVQNQLPVFNSSPNRTANPNEIYLYDVEAIDPEGTPIVYNLREGAPDGMTIDSETGLIQWTPTDNQVGQIPLTVFATDADGVRAVQSFLVTVGDPGGETDEESPVVNFGFASNLLNVGDELQFQVQAVDNQDIASLILEVDGTPVSLTPGEIRSGAINQSILLFDEPGLIEIVGTATDSAGNIGTRSLTIRVLDPSDTEAPDVFFDRSDQEPGVPISSPYDIRATVRDENLEFYRLEYAPVGLVDLENPAANDPDYVVLSEGTTSVENTVLGNLDPRLLDNDEYFVRIFAQDVSGNINVQGFVTGIYTANKVGNFTLDATDLTIPLTGIPIEISRQYDSLQADSSGSFGFGWELSGLDARITESVAVIDSGFNSIFGSRPFKYGDRVTLTTPDGDRVGFTFTPEVSFASLLGTVFRPVFTPDPGVEETLEVADIGLGQRADGSFGLFAFGFPYNPSEYKLTTKNNLTYTYDQFDGLQTISDLNGNVLTYSEDGIESSTGETILFERDGQDRITQITDPAGNAIVYEYDANGNLVSVSDRAGNETQYVYDLGRPHYLVEEIDPLGRSSVRTEYDDQGRITRIIDGDGFALELDINFDGPTDTQVITDPLNNTTILTYDDRGNVIQLVDAEGGVTQYEYFEDNRLKSLTDPRGNTTVYTYDQRGNLLAETDALGNVTTNTYNDLNQVLTTTDARGNVTTNRYDEQGNLLETIDARGFSTTYDYFETGNLQRITDANGNETNYQYDPLGRLTTVEDAVGAITTFDYDAIGNLVSITTPLGNTSLFGYNDEGQLVEVTDAKGNVTQIEYNAAGERSAVIDALGRRTEYSYNNRGLQTQIRYADGTASETVYDALDRAVTEIDQNGNETAFEYDGVDRLVAVIDALGQRTQYGYDASGNLVTQTDALGRTTTFEYDALNQLIVTELPLGQVETQTYDEVGNLASLTNFNGETITYEYDPTSLLSAVRLPDQADELYTYTPTGLVETITDGRGMTEFEYDALDQLTLRIDPEGAFIGYSYDLDGNIATLTTPSGTVTYTYDVLGLLETVEDRQGNLTQYGYDEVGNLIETQFANGIVETRDYDLLNRPILIANTNSNGDVIANYEYTLDNVGNRLSVEENTGRLVEYTYDDLYRLTQEKVTDPVNGDETTDYVYDAVGNRESRTSSVSGITTYTYDENDRLLTELLDGVETSYTYDDAGNLIEKRINGIVVEIYDWNIQGELAGVSITNDSDNTNIEYEYNSDGIRVSQTLDGETTNFLLDNSQQEFAQVIQEYNTNSTSVIYTHGLDLISQNRGGDKGYYHTDSLGSTRLITNNSGNVINTYLYDAYGFTTNQAETLDNPYKFTGEGLDSDLGSYYLRARYYNPATGRFNSRDPFPGFLERRLSLHDYLYAEGNPINAIDPSGNVASISYTSQVDTPLNQAAFSVISGLQAFGATNLIFIGNVLSEATVDRADDFLEIAFARTIEDAEELDDAFEDVARLAPKGIKKAIKRSSELGIEIALVYIKVGVGL